MPCDPLASACPAGQRCVPGATGHVCSTGDGVAIPDADVAGEASLPDAAEPDAPPGTVQKTYTATVAECIAPMFPSPQLCRNVNGNTQLVIDLNDSMTNDAWNAYLRFDLDDALAGKTITKVVLRLVATNDAKAPGPDTGSVFRVSAFSLASLMQAAPTPQGAALAGSQGTVSQGKVVSWTLPTSVATPGGEVYLGLLPNNDDGVNYFNTDGQVPPRLIIDAL